MKPVFVILRALIGTVFMVSGYSKLTAPFQNFLSVIHNYDVIYGAPATLLAQILPWIEFVTGVFLLLGLWSRATLVSAWFMNLMFVLVLAQGLLRGLPLANCGCFGDSFHLKPAHMLVLDILLMAAIFFLNSRRSEAFTWSMDDYFQEGKTHDAKKSR